MNSDCYKIETFIPREYLDSLREELNKVNALTIGGNYDNCMAVSKVIGSWRPLNNANPFKGKLGEVCKEEEYKVEFCCRESVVKDAINTIKKVHPYEEPVINIIPIFTASKFVKK